MNKNIIISIMIFNIFEKYNFYYYNIIMKYFISLFNL
jgi:hypothetical protein